ncbi:espin-like protein [Trichosurus vulpecula]|uniref:espin-like protein n=1 Tax=Trichosurus vulpecula TaxID=9337 RepID=UPI00186AEF49|nr:espin-like protein [Trichosurus vulpecula]
MGDQRALLAAKYGDLTTLKKFFENGVLDQTVTDSLGAGLVHHASRAGQLECLKFLIEHVKVPGNQRAKNRATPVHDAAAMGHLAELHWLVREGGYCAQDQDVSGVSPLHLAARFGHPVLVEWLVQEGCDVSLETLEGALPIHYAAVKGNLTCLKLLVAADNRCVNRQTQSGASPLYLACQEGHLHIVQFLVKDCGADVHLRAHDGMTVLHAAARSGHYSLVVWLVTFTDISLMARDDEGATVLHFAARGGHAPILDRLLLMGAQIIRDHWGGTPLHDAAENGHLECCQTLISHRVDPALQDGDGYTALDLAVYNGHHDCSRYLLEVQKLEDPMSAQFAVLFFVLLAHVSGAISSVHGQDKYSFYEVLGPSIGFVGVIGSSRGILEDLTFHASRIDSFLPREATKLPPDSFKRLVHAMMGCPGVSRLVGWEVQLLLLMEKAAQGSRGLTASPALLRSVRCRFDLVDLPQRLRARELMERWVLKGAPWGRGWLGLQVGPQVGLGPAPQSQSDPGCTHGALPSARSLLSCLSKSMLFDLCSEHPALQPKHSAQGHAPRSIEGHRISLEPHPYHPSPCILEPHGGIYTGLTLRVATIYNENKAPKQGKMEPEDDTKDGLVSLPMDELNPSDIDALVPTEDENGHPIPEWKRQVMVRKLQARLWSEEMTEWKSSSGDSTEMGDWRYSQTHNAILGPYGELLTEDDLVYLEKQIENLQMRKKCQEYESELGRLAEELQSLLPAPIVNITVNSRFLSRDPEKEASSPPAVVEGGHTLPYWCSHISRMVKSMSVLLKNMNGLARLKETPVPKTSFKVRGGVVGPSGSIAEKEILECGVSVRSLRDNFEKQANSGLPCGVRVPSEKCPGASWEAGAAVMFPRVQQRNAQTGERQAPGDPEEASDSGISCEEASSEAGTSPTAAPDSSSLRKERIVMLFLSHWKKSAYTPALKTAARRTLESSKAGLPQAPAVTVRMEPPPPPGEFPLRGPSKFGHLLQQRSIISHLLGNWKDVIAHVPPRQIRRLSRQTVTYSPEMFLPYVNGAPVDYHSLTLDLFMLGYFQILELDLPPEERKMRHLLCFEVFDHLGGHSWETVRSFHKAVTDEIEAGRRSWKDGFEDIKARFFGSSKKPVWEVEPVRKSGLTSIKPPPRASAPAGHLEPKGRRTGGCPELGSFNSEDICGYIDRSFAFWKEKEAEIFNFGD